MGNIRVKSPDPSGSNKYFGSTGKCASFDVVKLFAVVHLNKPSGRPVYDVTVRHCRLLFAVKKLSAYLNNISRRGITILSFFTYLYLILSSCVNV